MSPTILKYLMINLILFFPIFWSNRFLHEIGHCLACSIFKIRHNKPNFNFIRHPLKGGSVEINDEDWKKATSFQKKVVLISSLLFELVLFVALLVIGRIIVNKELLPIRFMIIFMSLILVIFIVSFVWNSLSKKSDLHRAFNIK